MKVMFVFNISGELLTMKENQFDGKWHEQRFGLFPEHHRVEANWIEDTKRSMVTTGLVNWKDGITDN